jgi:Protein of unknown function (DUF1427)
VTAFLLSAGLGLLVDVVYCLLGVKSRAPPVVAAVSESSMVAASVSVGRWCARNTWRLRGAADLRAGLDGDTRMRLDARLAAGGVGLRVICCAGFEQVMSFLPACFGAGSAWLAALGHLVAERNLLEGVRMAAVGGVLRAGTDLSAFGAAGGGRRGQHDRYRKGRTQHGRQQARPAHGLPAAHRARPRYGLEAISAPSRRGAVAFHSDRCICGLYGAT